MDINKSLENKILEFPEELQGLAKTLISAIDNNTKKSDIIMNIQDEIKGLISMENTNETTRN